MSLLTDASIRGTKPAVEPIKLFDGEPYRSKHIARNSHESSTNQACFSHSCSQAVLQISCGQFARWN
jgi:hypothetical protein